MPGPAVAQDHPLQRLQQTIGNQAVQRLLGGRPAHDTRERLVQRSASRLLQRDFRSDFQGRASAPAAARGAPAPAGTVRVQTIAGQDGTSTWVDAPFGIYSPGEIPAEYHDQIMESSKAYQWRNEGETQLAAMARDLARLENRGELTVRDLVRVSRQGGGDANIRIAMAKVGNDFRFVGYDLSHGGPGGAVHSGFVESEAGTTSGVGRALFADRVTRALLNQASGMNLEVYLSQRTADFHAQIFAVAGREGAPTEGTHYQLTTTEMVRLAVAWNSQLTPTQVSDLNALLARGGNVNAADAEAALLHGAVQDRAPRGPGGGGPSGSGGPDVEGAEGISSRAEAKGALLEFGAQALLAQQIENMQSAEKDKALKRFAELSPEIGRLLDQNYSVTITVEAEVPKTMNVTGVVTQTDPSMIVYYRNMYIDRAQPVLPKPTPGQPQQSSYYPMGDVDEKYGNPRRWDDPHEYTLDQQIRVQMGDPDPLGKDKPAHPTHRVMKQSQTFMPAILDALQTVKDHQQAPAPPAPKPKPMDPETAKKVAAAPTQVYLLTGNVVQYKLAAQLRDKLTANPDFKVTGEAMAGTGQTKTRVIYWSEYDKPRAEQLADFLRANGLPEARADSGGDPDKDPGHVQINFGADAEQ